MGAGEIAQGVGGEVSKAAQGPVDVLKTAFGVIGHLQAEEFLEKLVPGGGEIADFEIPGDEAGFELETEKDVQIVGDLVSLDADEGALHGVGGSPAVLPAVAGEVGIGAG